MDKKIDNKEYEHVLKVWDIFKIEKMKNYHNFHLKM